jgi:hypothetical protein
LPGRCSTFRAPPAALFNRRLHKGSKVSRDESFDREPGLRAALAYEVIYGKPVRELFAGLYEEVEQDVAKHARLLSYRKRALHPKRRASLINLASKVTL